MAKGLAHATPKPAMPRAQTVARAAPKWKPRLIRASMIGLMLAYVPFVLALAGAMLLGTFLFNVEFFSSMNDRNFRTLGRATLGILALDAVVLAASVLLLLGMLPLFFRRVYNDLPGMPLDLAKHPNLKALLERVCERLRTPMPCAVFISPFDDTSIADMYREVEPGKRRYVRTLVLGAGLVCHLRVDEFATIVCHEIAHAAGGDTRWSRWADRLYRSLGTQIGYFTDGADEEPGWMERVLAWMISIYFRAFALLYLADSRQCEFRADRVSARICGPQNVRNALIKVHLREQLEELAIARLWRDIAREGRSVDSLYEEHRRRWRELPAVRRERAENAMFQEQTSWWSSHPMLADRIRPLSAVRAKELSLPQPATRLFHNWSGIERHMTAQLLRLGRAIANAEQKYMDQALRGRGVLG